MSDCLFCRVVAGEIPANVVASDERYVAFRDIEPQAPTHVLVIPRVHIASLDEAEDAELLGGLFAFAREVARQSGVAESGYRAVVNTNADAQQTVPHLHVHIMGGRKFRWPPG